jgi:hypothetical protein
MPRWLFTDLVQCGSPTVRGVGQFAGTRNLSYITHPRTGEPPEIARVPAVRKTLAEAGINLRERTFGPVCPTSEKQFERRRRGMGGRQPRAAV